MTTYWVDPFLEATTQGAGTTDTSTENGTYAAPFSITRLIASTSASASALNSVTLSDGDELRIKGLAFTTLFGSEGNVYEARASRPVSVTTTQLQPITGNSTFDSTLSDTNSWLFAFQNSDISSYLPGWSHPLFFASTRYGVGANNRLETNIQAFTHTVLRRQLGYTSASSSGMELFRLKDTYANPRSISEDVYLLNVQADVKISAGWTSETAQNGYSVIEMYATGTFKDIFVLGGDSSTDTYPDLGRLIVCGRCPTAGVKYLRIRVDPIPYITDGGTGTVTMPMIVSADYYGAYFYSANSGIDCVFPLVSGQGESTGTNAGLIYHLTSDVMKFENWIAGQQRPKVNQSTATSQLEWGNVYCTSTHPSLDEADFRMFLNMGSSVNESTTHTFLSNSVYFLDDGDSSQGSTDEADVSLKPQFGNAVYQSGIKQPGLAPLSNLSSSSGDYGPNFGDRLFSSDIFRNEISISTNNNWYDPQYSRDGKNPINYLSVAKATCGGSDFRSASHNIKVSTATALSATASPKFNIVSAEHNDYDGKPISILSDPYTAGISYGPLMYNDSISSVSVLVGQWAGVTGGASTKGWIPLDLVVPSYTAGSDNLRVTVSAAYADGASNSAAGSILLRAWHRDTTQSNNFRVYSSSATAISAGGNPASPTTVTMNLTNVPTSGQDDITSVCLGIRLDFTDNTNIQKYYITNAAIETY